MDEIITDNDSNTDIESSDSECEYEVANRFDEEPLLDSDTSPDSDSDASSIHEDEGDNDVIVENVGADEAASDVIVGGIDTCDSEGGNDVRANDVDDSGLENNDRNREDYDIDQDRNWIKRDNSAGFTFISKEFQGSIIFHISTPGSCYLY